MNRRRIVLACLRSQFRLRWRLECASAFFLAVFTSSSWSQQTTNLQRAPLLEAATPYGEAIPVPPSNSAEPVELTLDELEQRALSSNPSVRRLSALVNAARGNSLQVGLPPNPSVGYEGQQLGSGGLAEQHGVVFTQEIVRGGKLRLNRAVANQEVMRLEQELAAQHQRVLTDVRLSFYAVLVAQRQIEIAKNLVRISDEGSATVDALYRANEVGRADILQAQLESENARILAENARNRYDAALRSLAAVVGEPGLAPVSLVGELTRPAEELDFHESLARLLERSPEISAAGTEVERARLALERARVERVGNVQVEGLVNWIDNGIDGKADGGILVSVPLPVFNRNQGGIARAEHELIAARQALLQLELDLQNRLAPVFEQYANARNQVERYQTLILPAAQESLDLTRKSYGSGEANYTSLLTAQRTYSQTQLNYLEAIRALRIAEVEINGLLLRGSLLFSSTVDPISKYQPATTAQPAGGL